MGKVLFNFKFQSVSDVITNSSSELFVFKNHNKDAVLLTLEALYPDWRKEYEEPEFVKDMSEEKFEGYVGWVFDFNMIDEDQRRSVLGLLNRPSEEEMRENWENYKEFSAAKREADILGLKPEEFISNWNVYNPFSEEWKDRYPEISELGMKKLKEYYADDIALWSYDDNPDWEYQEKLQEVAHRYHLG